jgi:hypothetical protein
MNSVLLVVLEKADLNVLIETGAKAALEDYEAVNG